MIKQCSSHQKKAMFLVIPHDAALPLLQCHSIETHQPLLVPIRDTASICGCHSMHNRIYSFPVFFPLPLNFGVAFPADTLAPY